MEILQFEKPDTWKFEGNYELQLKMIAPKLMWQLEVTLPIPKQSLRGCEEMNIKHLERLSKYLHPIHN